MARVRCVPHDLLCLFLQEEHAARLAKVRQDIDNTSQDILALKRALNERRSAIANVRFAWNMVWWCLLLKFVLPGRAAGDWRGYRDCGKDARGDCASDHPGRHPPQPPLPVRQD